MQVFFFLVMGGSTFVSILVNFVGSINGITLLIFCFNES